MAVSITSVAALRCSVLGTRPHATRHNHTIHRLCTQYVCITQNTHTHTKLHSLTPAAHTVHPNSHHRHPAALTANTQAPAPTIAACLCLGRAARDQSRADHYRLVPQPMAYWPFTLPCQTRARGLTPPNGSNPHPHSSVVAS